MLRKEFIISISIFILSSFVIFSMSWHGISQRVYLGFRDIKLLSEPRHAFLAWKEKGVKGRVLFLFDRKINARPEESFPSKDNYIYLSIMKNQIRKIFHIVPDSSWANVKEALMRNPSVSFSNGVFITTIEGAPLLIMRIKDIPQMKERILIHINGDYWEDGDIAVIIDLLKKNIISSDLVTLSGKFSENSLKEFNTYYEKFK